LAEVFKFSRWQTMSILPHHWRVLNLAENHMGGQRVPRALLFIITADFEKPLNLHPADMDHVFTTPGLAGRALDDGPQFGLLTQGNFEFVERLLKVIRKRHPFL
jgi:hypothetical protein